MTYSTVLHSRSLCHPPDSFAKVPLVTDSGTEGSFVRYSSASSSSDLSELCQCFSRSSYLELELEAIRVRGPSSRSAPHTHTHTHTRPTDVQPHVKGLDQTQISKRRPHFRISIGSSLQDVCETKIHDGAPSPSGEILIGCSPEHD